MSATPIFEQDPDDEEEWFCDDFEIAEDRSTGVGIQTDGQAPSSQLVDAIRLALTDLPRLSLQAAELMLDEYYSKQELLDAGVDEKLLPDETAPALAEVLELDLATFRADDLESFELDFSLPWDAEHSFNVEFEAGQAQSFTMNG
jgi:hypothetical protein